MTTGKSFKRLVRVRMGKTGESYTAARAVLLAAREPDGPEGPPLAASDDAIRQRTGRGWEEWFALLDGWDAAGLGHRETARRIAAELGIAPLAWNAQAITTSYERARGLRVVGQRADGFAVTATRTVAVPLESLFEAVVDPSSRARWLPGDRLAVRTSTAPRSARFDWADDGSRVVATFSAKGDARSTVTIEHARLPGAGEADRMKAFWREHLLALKSRLEHGGDDA